MSFITFHARESSEFLNNSNLLSFLIITDFKLFLKQNYPRNLSYLSTVFDNLVELYVLYLHMHIKNSRPNLWRDDSYFLLILFRRIG